MRILIIYNIADEKVRRKLGKKLADHGFALRPGIFECTLKESTHENVLKYLANLELRMTDWIAVYSICAACAEKRQIFGRMDLCLDDDGDCVII